MHRRTFPIEVGQRVYLVGTGNAAVKPARLITGKITKIARKYFYVEGEQYIWGKEAKFLKDTFYCYDHDNNFGYEIYPSKEAWEHEVDYETKTYQVLNALKRHDYKLQYSSLISIYNLLVQDGLISCEKEG